MSILQNSARQGNFTSSEIYALTKKEGTAAYNTYITECNYERLLGDAIETEIDNHNTLWGKFCEPRVHDLLGLSYRYCSEKTALHPTIPFWAGSADGFNESADGRAVVEIKCPATKKSFVQLTLPLYTGVNAIDAIRRGMDYKGIKYPAHPDGEKYYWQIVSNAIINDCEYGELIVYMPYGSELLELANMAGDDPRYRRIKNSDIASLKDGGIFKNLNIMRFAIPKIDKDYLTERVEAAGKLLIADLSHFVTTQVNS